MAVPGRYSEPLGRRHPFGFRVLGIRGLDRIVPCCSPPPPLPSSRSSFASSSRSWSWPTSSGAPDVEGAGPKARPARSVASGPPHRSHTAAGSQLTPTPTRSSPAAGTTATRTRGSHARESGEESVASGAAPPNQRRVIPREPVLVGRSRAPGRSGVSCCSPRAAVRPVPRTLQNGSARRRVGTLLRKGSRAELALGRHHRHRCVGPPWLL